MLVDQSICPEKFAGRREDKKIIGGFSLPSRLPVQIDTLSDGVAALTPEASGCSIEHLEAPMHVRPRFGASLDSIHAHFMAEQAHMRQLLARTGLPCLELDAERDAEETVADAYRFWLS